MLQFVFICFVFMTIGGFAIWRGKRAIRNRHMSNSLKSSLITGVSEIKGDTAVKLGKVSVVLGAVICAISGLVLLLGMGFFMLSMFKERTSSVAERDRDSSSRGRPDGDDYLPRDRDSRLSGRRRRTNDSRTRPAVADRNEDEDDFEETGDDEFDSLLSGNEKLLAGMSEQQTKLMADAEERMRQMRKDARSDASRFGRGGTPNRRGSRGRSRSDDTSDFGFGTSDEDDSNEAEEVTPTENPVVAETKKEKDEFEIWESANGKYSIEAKYVRQTGEKVFLEKKDGKVLEVEIASLGEDEQTRIAFRE